MPKLNRCSKCGGEIKRKEGYVLASPNYYHHICYHERKPVAKKIVITRDIEGIEEVEKLVSLNPDRWEWKDFYEMLDAYRAYCFEGAKSTIMNYSQPDQLKTFKQWLDTEI